MQLERSPRFSWPTLGVGIVIGLVAAFVVNLVVAAVIGLVKLALLGAVAVAALWFFVIGPKGRR